MAGRHRLIVRPAGPADAADVACISTESWQAAYARLIPEAALATIRVERREHFYRSVLRDQRTRRTWIALRAGTAVGFASSGPARSDVESGTGELYAIYLHPDHYGTGAGRPLLRRAIASLKSVRYETAILWVLAGNHRARRFYEANGWRADGTKRMIRPFGYPLGEVRYRRDL